MARSVCRHNAWATAGTRSAASATGTVSRPPGSRVPGIAHQEQQPGDGDLGLDVYLDAADPGRADFPGGTDLPGSRAVRGWRGGDDAGGSQGSSLFRCEQPLDAWP